MNPRSDIGSAVTSAPWRDDAGVPLGDFVVTDRNVVGHYPALQRVPCVVIEPGEASKNLETYAYVARELVRLGISRSGRIMAVGGGVVGDLAGFVASTLLRGVPLIQVPTSLLAMVDSAIGSKVGIDLPEGKNLLGSFYPPQSIHIDPQFLQTLPVEEFVNGCAEIVKYGFITPGDLQSRIRQPLTKESPDLEQVIWNCIKIKDQVVTEDPYERTGKRAILNFGHTVGHALESWMNYQGIRHGEAVAIGMVAEIEVGHELGVTPFSRNEIEPALIAQGLPTSLAVPVEVDALMSFMRRDKKNSGQGISMSLLSGPGECKLVTGIDPDRIARKLKQIWSC